MPEYFANSRGDQSWERKPKRGGSRPGSGRKPKHPAGPMLHASIRLPAEWQEDLRAEFGSLQAAVEALVLAHREKAQP